MTNRFPWFLVVIPTAVLAVVLLTDILFPIPCPAEQGQSEEVMPQVGDTLILESVHGNIIVTFPETDSSMQRWVGRMRADTTFDLLDE